MPDIALTTSSGDMTVVELGAQDAKTAVIVVQEAFGLNNHIREVAEDVSTAGHLVLAPDFYHKQASDGKGLVVDYDDLGTALDVMVDLKDSDSLDVVATCLNYLESEKGFGLSAIGIMGFCMGGRIAFLTALNHSVGAAVSFYGGGIVTENIDGTPALTEQAPNIKTPWLGFFGDLDAMIPTEGVMELEETISSAKFPTQIIRYADGDHGFHCNERESYNESASSDAWKKTLGWFNTHLS